MGRRARMAVPRRDPAPASAGRASGSAALTAGSCAVMTALISCTPWRSQTRRPRWRCTYHQFVGLEVQDRAVHNQDSHLGRRDRGAVHPAVPWHEASDVGLGPGARPRLEQPGAPRRAQLAPLTAARQEAAAPHPAARPPAHSRAPARRPARPHLRAGDRFPVCARHPDCNLGRRVWRDHGHARRGRLAAGRRDSRIHRQRRALSIGQARARVRRSAGWRRDWLEEVEPHG